MRKSKKTRQREYNHDYLMQPSSLDSEGKAEAKATEGRRRITGELGRREKHTSSRSDVSTESRGKRSGPRQIQAEQKRSAGYMCVCVCVYVRERERERERERDLCL
mgnify:FL=1